MVFEILGVNLLEVLKRYDYKGLPLHLVKEITRQVAMGLDFLNRICRVIHTDLKPENVLLCLTDEEIKKIVEDGQLSNQTLYHDRLSLYRSKYGLGPVDGSDSEPERLEVEEKVEEDPFSTEISSHITELSEKLEDPSLTKNQRKTYKRKLKKLEEKAMEHVEEEKKKQDKPKKKVKEPRKKKTEK